MAGQTRSATRTRHPPASLRLGTASGLESAGLRASPHTQQLRAPSNAPFSREQYLTALPLRASLSHGNRQAHKPVYGSLESTDDLLRRKTPGGTLEAAYNGTFAESDTRPHASKHLLLPGAVGTTYQSPHPTRNYSNNQPLSGEPDYSNSYTSARHGYADAWAHDRGHYAHTSDAGSAYNTPQVDSTLWSLPSQYHAMDWQYTHNTTPQVMQAPYQPPLGPTASQPSNFYNAHGYNPAGLPQCYSDRQYTSAHHWAAHQQQPYDQLHLHNQLHFDARHSSSLPLQPNSLPQQHCASGLPRYGSSNMPWTPRHDSALRHTSPYNHQQASSGYSSGVPQFQSDGAPPVASASDDLHSPDYILTKAFAIYRDLLMAIKQIRDSNDKHKQSKSRWNTLPSFLTQDEAASATRGTPGARALPILPALGMSVEGEKVRSNASSWSSNQKLPYDPAYQQPPYRPPTDTYQESFRAPSGADILGPIWGHYSNRQWTSTNELQGAAMDALRSLNEVCERDSGGWVEGMLLNGCLSYVLGEHENAIRWYAKILKVDPGNIEATSNLAATYLAQNRRREAEHYWRQAVRLKPTYFEAIEQLVQLLCSDRRQQEAVQIVDHIQGVLKSQAKYEQGSMPTQPDTLNFSSSLRQSRPNSRYACSDLDNSRLMALVHAKGNILYNIRDQQGAARAFEEVVLIAVGQKAGGIESLIQSILHALSVFAPKQSGHPATQREENLLLPPEKALQTAKLCFPYFGDLPGLVAIDHQASKKVAVSLASNSLLSLAKIFQDGMNPNISPSPSLRSQHGVRDILAMYYLSLSLQPSPSTANNVGILLASVQQSVTAKTPTKLPPGEGFMFPGVIPGSGIALALTYYKYGLNLDAKHAHLFTNLGSLLKDIGQLPMAIQMYEKAVQCDSKFDIALANLANAVKDEGKVADAIQYYRKAVEVNPNFAEAVCGLVNALNSVCDWRGRGGVRMKAGLFDRWHVDATNELSDSRMTGQSTNGWIKRVVDIVESQLQEAKSWGQGVLRTDYVQQLSEQLSRFGLQCGHSVPSQQELLTLFESWKGQSWEGAKIVWMIERATRWIAWQWYQDRYVYGRDLPDSTYSRPRLPDALSVPGAPTILPFHTFTLPVDAKQVRLISQRNGLRVSSSTLRSSWLPQTVFTPPSPPAPQIRVGYVSSDFNNHPLAHLMQSVFGMHDETRVHAHCYATTASDNSAHRHQIEREAPTFYDASGWSTERLVQQILADGIHVLVNLNGYTRGARNEIFAARPAPIQMSFMGFAGTLGAEWCDYLLADETAVPAGALRPARRNVDLEDFKEGDSSGGSDDWVYAENIIYTRDTFFCCDHRQTGSNLKEQNLTWAEEQRRRWQMRKDLFPNIEDDAVIFGNFNQLYKIDPTTFRTWLRILSRVPNAYLWLLRFPTDGATHLLSTARKWAGPHIASRILFTDVAPKATHIARGCIADLFLDTPECNAHTTAADCLWSGTPLLTLPRYEWKMCSRMAAGILGGALDRTTEAGREAWSELVAHSEEEYEDTAVRLGREMCYLGASSSGGLGTSPKDTSFSGCSGVSSTGGLRAKGRLMDLRKMIWEGRWTCKLFDTRRWVRDLEVAYAEAWRRWVAGEGGDIWLKDFCVGG